MKQDTSPKWPLWQTFAFRAFSLYLNLFFLFVSYYANSYSGTFPWIIYLNKPFSVSAIAFTSLVNKLFIHKQFHYELYLADTYWDYICTLSFFILAIIVALVWTSIDKGKKFVSLGKYTNLLARYYLAFILAYYAAGKLVVDTQFGFWDAVLMRPAGQVSPHALFWTLTGASTLYTNFGGALELAACLLLLFRRTSTAGALLAVPVMVNILVLDIAYDTWVKIEVFHLLLFAAYILLPDIKSLFRFVVLRQNTALSAAPQLAIRGRYAWLHYLLKYGFIGATFFAIIKFRLPDVKYELNPPYTKVEGIHQIMDISGGGQTKTVSRNDSTAWEKIAIEEDGSMETLAFNGKLLYFDLKKGDPVKGLLQLSLSNDSTYRCKLHYTNTGKDRWLFVGTIKNDSVRFTTERTAHDKTKLLKDKGRVNWFYLSFR